MKLSLARPLALAVGLTFVTSGAARADDVESTPELLPSGAQPQGPTQQQNVATARGWALVVISVVVGGTVTGVSLAKKCRPEQTVEDCARWVSLGIWSGIGIASIGTMAGLVIVRQAQRPRVQLSFSGISGTF